MSVLKTMKMLAGAAAVSIASLGAAQAASVTFTFEDVTQGGSSDTITSGGITLTIESFAPPGNAGEDLLTLFSNDALGVGDGGTGPGTDIQDLLQIGGEFFRFTFSQPVEFLSMLVFESGTGTDDLGFVNVTGQDFGIFGVADQGNGNSGDKDFRIDLTGGSVDNIGSVFHVLVVDSTGSNQGLAILDLEVAPVPLPAGMALMLTGLGGLVLARRRKTA